MKKGLTELVFVLDESGSMHGCEADTIGGFNGLIDELRAAGGEVKVTAICFSHDVRTVLDCVDVKDVRPLTEKDYRPSGGTALLDAVGSTIDAVGLRLSNTPEDERPEKVLFAITTDGEENASRGYTLESVKNKVKHQSEKYSWEFLFFGANIDAFGAADGIGVGADRTHQYCSSNEMVLGCMIELDERIKDYYRKEREENASAKESEKKANASADKPSED